MTNSYKKYLLVLVAITLLNGDITAMKRLAEDDDLPGEPPYKIQKIEQEPEDMSLEESSEEEYLSVEEFGDESSDEYLSTEEEVVDWGHLPKHPFFIIFDYILQASETFEEVQNSIMSLRMTNQRFNEIILKHYTMLNKKTLQKMAELLWIKVKLSRESQGYKFKFQPFFDLLFKFSDNTQWINNVMTPEFIMQVLLLDDEGNFDFSKVPKLYASLAGKNLGIRKRLLEMAQQSNMIRPYYQKSIQRNEQLIYATYTGDLQQVQELLEQGVDLAYKSEFTRVTPFIAAIQGDQIGVIQWLCENFYDQIIVVHKINGDIESDEKEFGKQVFEVCFEEQNFELLMYFMYGDCFVDKPDFQKGFRYAFEGGAGFFVYAIDNEKYKLAKKILENTGEIPDFGFKHALSSTLISGNYNLVWMILTHVDFVLSREDEDILDIVAFTINRDQITSEDIEILNELLNHDDLSEDAIVYFLKYPTRHRELAPIIKETILNHPKVQWVKENVHYTPFYPSQRPLKEPQEIFKLK